MQNQFPNRFNHFRMARRLQPEDSGFFRGSFLALVRCLVWAFSQPRSGRHLPERGLFYLVHWHFPFSTHARTLRSLDGPLGA